MTSLAKALAIVAGLNGEQDPAQIDELLTSPNSYEITDAIVSTAEGVDDPRQKQSILYGLQRAVSQIARDVDAATDAESIQRLLPEIDKLLANWDDPNNPPGHGLDDYDNPVHELQAILGIEHDGLWGTNTTEALIAYEIDSLTVGFAGDFSIDTRQFDAINNYALANTFDAYMERNRAISSATEIATLEGQLDTQTQTLNEFISEEFERCTGEAIDLSEANPFADILQDFEAYDQIADEQSEAYVHVADAVQSACGHYLERIEDPAAKEELITNLASELEQPLQQAVEQGIQAANEARELERFRDGMITERIFSNWNIPNPFLR